MDFNWSNIKVKIPDVLLKDRKINEVHLAIYGIIESFNSTGKKAYFTSKFMADLLKMKLRTFEWHLHNLKELGYVSRHKVPGQLIWIWKIQNLDGYQNIIPFWMMLDKKLTRPRIALLNKISQLNENMKKGARFSHSWFAENLDMTNRQVEFNLNFLKKHGYIDKESCGDYSRWVVLKRELNDVNIPVDNFSDPHAGLRNTHTQTYGIPTPPIAAIVPTNDLPSLVSYKSKPVDKSKNITLSEALSDNPHSLREKDIEAWLNNGKPNFVSYWRKLNRDIEQASKMKNYCPHIIFRIILKKEWNMLNPQTIKIFKHDIDAEDVLREQVRHDIEKHNYIETHDTKDLTFSEEDLKEALGQVGSYASPEVIEMIKSGYTKLSQLA